LLLTNSNGAALLKNPAWRPYIVLAIGVLAVSSSAILIRFARQEGASALTIAAWRVGLAALVLTPIVLVRHRADLARLSRREIGFALLAGVLLGAHFGSWITSLDYTSVMTSVVLVTTSPLWVAVGAPILLREKLHRWTVAAIIVAFIGAILISAAGDVGAAPRQDAPLLGAGLAIVGAITVAGYYIVGRQVRGKIALIPYIWLAYGTAAIVLWITVFATGHTIAGVAGLPPSALFWMTLTALIPQLIGHSAYNYALGYLPAVYVTLTVLGEPIGSTILAAIIFPNEQPTPQQLFGGALILLALIVASWEEMKALRRQAMKQTTEQTAEQVEQAAAT
jgi:drug/metabolite transporter (DMT)-like permease